MPEKSIEPQRVAMAFAIGQGGTRINVQDAVKGGKYTCPVCGADVIPRQGAQNAWHYAHSTPCSDPWHYDMSEWHRNWQARFPEACREVVITRDGQSHRADVLMHDTVLEFQHSPISSSEFQARNDFYTQAGYRVLWVFDALSQFSSGDIQNDPNNDDKFRWKNPYRAISSICPQASKKVAILLHLYVDPDTVEDPDWLVKVEWAIPEDDGSTSYGLFYTDSNFAIDIFSNEGLSECFQNKYGRFNAFLKAHRPYSQKCKSYYKAYPPDWKLCPQTDTNHQDRCVECPYCLIREYRRTTKSGSGGLFYYCCWPRAQRASSDTYTPYIRL